MREREIKFVAEDPNFELPALDGVDGMHAASTATTDLHAAYYDTPDLRLSRAGASLRYRAPEGWTVKLPGEVTGGVLTRPELSFGGAPGVPPPVALDAVLALTRGAPVDVVARLRARRTRTDVHDEAGRKVAEIVDDDVAVLNSSRPSKCFREVEVEIAPDAPRRTATRLTRRLREAGAGEPEAVPKIVRALGRPARRPSDVVVPPSPKKEAMADAVIRAAVASSVARLVRHDPGVRVGEDAEDLHQARVAVRRLRSDLRTFAPMMEHRWTEPTRAELAWLGDMLGAVRDLDVLRELLESQCALLPEDRRAAAGALFERLAACRAQARAELLSAMRSERYVALLDRLVGSAPVDLIAAGTPKLRGADALPPLVSGPWKKLRRAVRDAGTAPSDAALHQIRIRAKRARYATEAVAPLVGRRARVLAERLAVLQDVLGEHHDCVVGAQWLHDTAAEAGGEEAFVAGELTMVLRARQAELRGRWRGAWRSVRDRRVLGWF